MVRLEPLPPNTMFATGTRFVFEEEAVNTSESAGILASPIVKLMGPVELLLLTTTSGMGEMVGATRVLIHWSNAATALVSIRLRASGGILIMESVLFTRRYMMDLARSWGATTFAP